MFIVDYSTFSPKICTFFSFSQKFSPKSLCISKKPLTFAPANQQLTAATAHVDATKCTLLQ
jgi:hypothetical protein